jgi:hypothetical protein
MDNIPNRLRSSTEWFHTDCELKQEAASRIEALEAQLATTPSPEAVVKAALKWAMRKIEDESNHQNDVWIDACEHVAFEIGFAATDTATIAAIIKTAREDWG